GLFHLMTHAFFKALLFMGAGSVIAAMANEQSLDKMGGFRKAMPFTYITFTAGALALAGFPLTAGFFSKDEILAYTIARGDWFVVLAAVGYLAAFLTAIYSFRLVFRVFHGEPCAEARELEGGHLAHAEPFNPATGEAEDTEAGFPGAEHHIAEREGAMKAAMGPLAILAIVAGLIQIPGVTDVLGKFLEPTFAGSHSEPHPTTSAEYIGMAVGALISIAGIAVAARIWLVKPGTSARLQARFAGIHRVLEHKYYFDEAYDLVFVRPLAAAGRFGRDVVERGFIQGFVVGGTVAVVRAASAFARGIQNGELRSYASVLVLGMGGVLLYFLIAAS
ncbi:MAG: NADH-quinone oxidoreductase subunit L, partial [Solirubrobacterales bacterium]|nr:NADH-quinone oxidoreductase subunit L [Solirubrobacterales bacterium]